MSLEDLDQYFTNWDRESFVLFACGGRRAD